MHRHDPDAATKAPALLACCGRKKRKQHGTQQRRTATGPALDLAQRLGQCVPGQRAGGDRRLCPVPGLDCRRHSLSVRSAGRRRGAGGGAPLARRGRRRPSLRPRAFRDRGGAGHRPHPAGHRPGHGVDGGRAAARWPDPRRRASAGAGHRLADAAGQGGPVPLHAAYRRAAQILHADRQCLARARRRSVFAGGGGRYCRQPDGLPQHGCGGGRHRGLHDRQGRLGFLGRCLPQPDRPCAGPRRDRPHPPDRRGGGWRAGRARTAHAPHGRLGRDRHARGGGAAPLGVRGPLHRRADCRAGEAVPSRGRMHGAHRPRHGAAPGTRAGAAAARAGAGHGARGAGPAGRAAPALPGGRAGSGSRAGRPRGTGRAAAPAACAARGAGRRASGAREPELPPVHAHP